MTASKRARWVRLGAEVALAFGAGAAFFALVAVTAAATHSGVLAAGIGAVAIAAVVAMARFWGAAYAVPAAMAGLLAYDWYQIPPIHPRAFPNTANLVNLIAYLGVGVLVGEAVASAGRRADVTEAARSRLADEQAALRRVATLVARELSPDDVVAAVAREVGVLLDVDGVRVLRFEGADEALQLAGWSAPGDDPPRLGRVELAPPSMSCDVPGPGRGARIDDDASVDRMVARLAHAVGVASGVGAPIVVDGRRWGAILAWSLQPRPVAAKGEPRLAAFTELVAMAISNTASRTELARLADEQAALRRVATLVARDVPPPEVFGAVAREVGQLLGVDATHMGRYEPDHTTTGVGSWSRTGRHMPIGTRAGVDGKNVSSLVWRTGRPARMDDYDDVPGSTADRLRRELGVRSSVGAPIVVEGNLWGVMIASSTEDEPLPSDTEPRIAAFTELVATAISNTEARGEVARLAEEQAALRRVATLVAQGVPSSTLVGAVAEEVGALLGTDLAGMIRYESDRTVTAVAAWATDGEHADVDGRWPLEGGNLGTTILETCRPARIDDYDGVPGRIAAFMREELGVRSSVGSPIVVEGRLWGALFVHSTRAEPLPADTESRLLNFTELVATAMANVKARAEVGRLADEQAALRRVATVVARESPPSEVFAAVAEEVARVLDADMTRIQRYEADGTVTVVANWGVLDATTPVGSRLGLGGRNITSLVQETRRPVRIDDYAQASGSLGDHARKLGVRCAVGSPIVVEGRIWGVIIAASRQVDGLPAGTAMRVGEFTALVATAISNIQARTDLAASRARIVAAADEERRRVVRDLHDGAQQRLVHTVVTLKLAHSALHDEEKEAGALVAEALEQAEEATAEIRELAHGILPSVLTGGGLHAGVDALASRMAMPVENGVSVDRLPATVEATAYYVVAEALTNVAKHARAAHVAVTASVEDGALRVGVRDDGIGGARPDGSGLLGLGDRLAALDGRLIVQSPPDGGTLIAATIPLPR